jgi:hypothetical protein
LDLLNSTIVISIISLLLGTSRKIEIILSSSLLSILIKSMKFEQYMFTILRIIFLNTYTNTKIIMIKIQRNMWSNMYQTNILFPNIIRNFLYIVSKT